MHRIIPLFAALLVVSVSTASAEETWHNEINSALSVAKQLQRPLVISIEKNGCLFCKTMRDSTWADSKIDASIRSNFVALRMDKNAHAKFVSKLKLKRFPATVIYSKSGKLVAKKEGLMFAGECRAWLETAEDKMGIVSAEALVQKK